MSKPTASKTTLVLLRKQAPKSRVKEASVKPVDCSQQRPYIMLTLPRPQRPQQCCLRPCNQPSQVRKPPIIATTYTDDRDLGGNVRTC
jgi:hypothetical protein